MDFWTLATAMLCGLICSLTGCWLVLKRMSMMADAMSHSVLPGLIGAFLFTGSRSSSTMLIGALLAALVTIGLTHLGHRLAKIQEEAALGVSFSVLFALGVFLVTRYASQIDLDPGCVLYGNIETVIFDTLSIYNQEIPRVFFNLLAYGIVSGLLFFILRCSFLTCVFDPAHANVIGRKPSSVQSLLFIIIACCTVVCFEAVGSILVIALMIVPAASAQLLTRKLNLFFLLSALLGTISSFLGYFLAVLLNSSVAGCVATMLGIVYCGSAISYALTHRLSTKTIYKNFDTLNKNLSP